MDRQLTDGLWWQPTERGATVLAHTPQQPLLAFDVSQSDARIELLLFHGARGVDLSIQPAATSRLVGMAALAGRHDPGRWYRALSDQLILAAPEWGRRAITAPTGSEQEHLTGAIAAVTHPVLGSAIAAGADPLDQIPSWAARPLRAWDLPGAARAAFGDRASGPVITELGAALRPHDGAAHIDLAAIGLGMAASAVVGSGHVAQILRPTGDRPSPDDWPEPEDLPVVRRALRFYRPGRAVDLVLEALRRPGGVPTLVAAARAALACETQLERPLPHSLDGLARACHPSSRSLATSPR